MEFIRSRIETQVMSLTGLSLAGLGITRRFVRI